MREITADYLSRLVSRQNGQLRTAAAGALFLLGAVLGALSLILPHPAEGEAVIWLTSALAAAVGLALLIGGRHVPIWGLHASVAAAAPLISVSIVASGTSSGVYGTMFFWIAVYAAYFFRPRVVVAHLIWVLTCFAVALALVDSTAGYGSFTRWIFTGMALAVTAGMTSWLVALRERTERKMTRSFDLSLDMLCTADARGYFKQLNGTWEQTLGYSLDELRRTPFIDFVHPDDRERTEEESRRLFENSGYTSLNFENRYRTKDGNWRWLSWAATVATDEGIMYARATDVTGRKRLERDREELLAKVESQARTDALTGLPNRRWMTQELERELLRAARQGLPLCAAMIDLDHFKTFNDRHGHAQGDALLVEAGGAWRLQLRASDFMARLGGEEFVVLLPDCRASDAASVVDRLRGATPRDQTCSAGIAQWIPGEAGFTLLSRADAALYAAKTGGRNRAVVAAVGRHEMAGNGAPAGRYS